MLRDEHAEGKAEGIIEGRAQGIIEGKAEGIIEGRVQGIIEGKASAVCELLEDLGHVPEDIRIRIESEKNLETLARWHKLAAKADSLEEFLNQM